jgi:hypothetical protein
MVSMIAGRNCASRQQGLGGALSVQKLHHDVHTAKPIRDG